VLEEQTLAFIGAGVMAEAIASGLVRAKLVSPDHIIVSHYRPMRLEEFARSLPVQTTIDNCEAYRRADIALLCVRPQSMLTVLRELKPVLTDEKLLISIAAGLPIAFYEREFGQPVPFIRAMPTYFSRIRAGTTALALNPLATAQHLALASRLFGAVSENVIVLPDEEMNTFTTFGATTTATVYLLLDALITAGSLIGLRHHDSHSRALEQVKAAALNVASTDKLPSQLLDEICTPGGVTVEGVKILEERAVRGAIIDAILAATRRAEELRRSALGE
jgi:pyrroline-5-carboxylate reductase